jgi:hypothetical protein
MLAIYLVGGHVRARLTRLVVRAVAGLLLSSRLVATGRDVSYVFIISPFFV